MEVFKDSEDQYLAWIREYKQGYVLNVPKHHGQFVILLHSASCRFISPPAFRNFVIGDYYKCCPLKRNALITWASGIKGGWKSCGHCHP